MLINFASGKVKPIIQCATPANEESDVSNLISLDPVRQAKGFVAYPCIRPPVDINFEFICPINIHHIVLWPSVHAQKSTAFEILAAPDKHSPMESVGKYYCDNLDVKTVLFFNGRTFNSNNVSSDINTISSKCNLKSSCWKINTNCFKLAIRILRTKNSVPCLGKIEVWGFVSRNCPDKLKALISKMYFGDKTKSNVPVTSNEKRDENPSIELEKSSIPEDFLDAITYEVMSKPVTLPSGNTIDESTLEKHNLIQDKWARAPFDPFTGKPFTKDSKPIFNAALKRRIDNYLILHQDNIETKNIPRTVGSGASSTSNLEPQPQYDQEKNLMDPLDHVLNNAFKNLKRYTSDDSIDSNKKLLVSCSQCNKTDHLYILTCKHFLCKNCINSIFSTRNNPKNCLICSKKYTRNDITRYHDPLST